MGSFGFAWLKALSVRQVTACSVYCAGGQGFSCLEWAELWACMLRGFGVQNDPFRDHISLLETVLQTPSQAPVTPALLVRYTIKNNPLSLSYPSESAGFKGK